MKRFLFLFFLISMCICVHHTSFAQNTLPLAAETEEAPQGLYFGVDTLHNNAVLGETVLEPGTEYRFPVSMIFQTQTVPLTEEIMKGMRFYYSKYSDSATKTFKIEEYKKVYYLFIELKEAIPNKIMQEEHTIKFAKRDDQITIFAQKIKFEYGYYEHSDDEIENLTKGEEVAIRNHAPIISKVQFEHIAKVNNYYKVMLTGPSWGFEVNVTDEDTKNFLSNQYGIKEILAAYPEQKFKFFNFPGKPSFEASGRVLLDVADIVDEFETFYVYRYKQGNLYQIDANLHRDTDTLEFWTDTLDHFVVTNGKLNEGPLPQDAFLDFMMDE